MEEGQKSLSMREVEGKESFVMLPKKYLKPLFDLIQEPLKDFEIAVYAVVDSMRTELLKCSMLNIRDILEIMGYYPNSNNINRVKNALITLQEEGIIFISEDRTFSNRLSSIGTKQNLYIKRSIESLDNTRGKYYVYGQNEGFVKLFSQDLFKIFNSELAYKDKLLRVYIEIMSCVFYTNTNYRAAFPSIDTIAKETKYDRKTVLKMIGNLYEMEVLVCLQVQYKEKSRNFYSRVMHQEELKYAVRDFIEENKAKLGIPKVVRMGNWSQNNGEQAS